jgi:dipeptidyl-peptidase-4
MFGKFSPSGRHVAYLRDRNICVQNVRTLGIRRLTTDGSDTIVNGTGDWVYEEEFELRDGFQWSPDGRFVAYWQFDTSGVPTFSLVNDTDSLYPAVVTIPYPKAGQKNSACRVGVVKASGGKTRWLRTSNDPRNHYIPKMGWAAGSKAIVLQQLNRLQNTNEVIIADVRTGTSRKVLCEQDSAWVDVDDGPTWLDDGKRFIWPSERDGWQHLYLVSRSGAEMKLLTPGQSDVIRLECADKEGAWACYTASPDNPTQQYLYRAPLDGGGNVERLTPPDPKGTHSYDISPDCKWALHTYSSFGVPPVVELISLPDHRTIRTLADNSELRDKLAALKKGPAEFFRVDIGDGVMLDAWCIKPPDFDPDGRYPLLFHVYGEPAGQTVLDRWGGNTYLWHLMLAQRGCVVMSVDNRGTPAPRGRQWRKCIYGQVGILASADQAAAAREIIAQRPYIDPNRVGIWGWSGGGSMTLNAIFRYPCLYRTAIAIAFISDQRFYDTIYQERYMGLPDDNPQGYKNGSPITFAHQLEGNLLLVHGTGDDNCHYQNCEALVNELIKHKKPFTMMAYPNRTHSLKEGEGTTPHLYKLMTCYLEDNLLIEY